MTRTVLALALTLFPVSADAAMLRASLPSHVPPPREQVARAHVRAEPRARAPRRPVTPRKSQRGRRATTPLAWTGERQVVAPQLALAAVVRRLEAAHQLVQVAHERDLNDGGATRCQEAAARHRASRGRHPTLVI